MALESASFINQLVAINPTGADPKGQGDDHVRLLKRVLQATFPNLNSAVTVTPAQLNQLAQANLFMQPGMIVMWSGALNALPAGWLLCNGVGTISTGLSVPDLRDRFIVGAGASYAVRSVGGTFSHNHAISVSVAPHAITINEMPNHNHNFRWQNNPTTELRPGIGAAMLPDNIAGAYANVATNRNEPVGGGQPHSHAVSYSIGPAVAHIPPYIAVGFIIKV